MSETDVKGTVLGYDATCKVIRIGDTVEHVNYDLGKGVVVTGGLFYKDEAACMVNFAKNPEWTARLSKLRVVAAEPPKPKTLADFGYKVGDKIHHKKYDFIATITFNEVGTYKGEPCCFTGGGRPTRFSQIEPAPEIKTVEKFTFTTKDGKIIRIEIE